ncbi:pirin family protein [Thalassotalea agarivorans]|uniref:Pirin N-terminal domain-containing protein n=1 Tax=Thalassotalea agarivorans TaxID=349064 RepID=A0A1I0HPK1_THASX|nr:pirin family protein [Thalassotalea agarivorans]SET85082.1 hypothetical protein SAMN05660429_02848 [Thalassotalea agarivorans]
MKVIQVRKASPTQDGAGVKISRVADFSGAMLDPFLMIDELKSDDNADFIGGFPPHPHRGIETFTYMIKGGFEHQDHMGNKKAIRGGDVQWMSTGSGVIHSEMPLATDEGMHGFQIWLNMPAKDKMRAAIYQDSVDSPLPELVDEQGSKLRALAGQWHFAGQSVTSPLKELSSGGAIADLTLAANGTAEFDLSDYDLAMAYIHTGSLDTANGGRGHMLVLDSQSAIQLEASAQGAGVLLFAGNKINEKIVHYGPFVMNTHQEIEQAIADYQSGKMGRLSL